MNEILRQVVTADTDLMLAINGLHAALFDGFMWGYTKVFVWVPFYAALVFLLYKNQNWKTVLWMLACVALTILICDQVTSHLIRPVVQRLRPANLDNPVGAWVHVVNEYRGGRYSFPSAHASNTFGLAFFLMYLFRYKVLTALLLVWAFLNCYSRIYLGVHYPGDILAGMLVGLLAASFSYVLFKHFSSENPAHKPVHLLWLPFAAWLLTVASLFAYSLFYY